MFNIGQTEGDIVAAQRKGHTRLSVRFATGLPEAVTLIAYAKFPSVVKIDHARNAILP